MSSDVFLSYSKRDEALARALVDTMQQAGVSVWWDTKLLPGENWERSIREALEGAKIVVVLISEHSLESKWVQAEVMRAYATAGNFLPVLAPGMTFDRLPSPLRVIQAIRLGDPGLVPSIKVILARHGATNAGRDSAAAEKAATIEATAATGRQIDKPESKKQSAPNSIFVVHGHDQDMLQAFVAELKNLGVKPIVLREFDTAHDFLYEKFRALAEEARFALVLVSGDDVGTSIKDYKHPAGAERALQYRARQNVILELGFFFGALGPDKVFVFQREAPTDTTFLPRLERPSDLDGRMFLSFDEAGAWREKLRLRLADHGFEIELR